MTCLAKTPVKLSHQYTITLDLKLPKSDIFFYSTSIFSKHIISYNARIRNPGEGEPKYKWARGSRKHIYCPSGNCSLDEFRIITEGEKKALGIYLTTGIPTIAVAGVNCFRTPELEKLDGQGREVMVLYDDPEHNENVLVAEQKLCVYLRKRNFDPIPIHIPDKVDDYLIKVGPDVFREFLAKETAEYKSRRRGT
jgi:hypothetical protein